MKLNSLHLFILVTGITFICVSGLSIAPQSANQETLSTEDKFHIGGSTTIAPIFKNLPPRFGHYSQTSSGDGVNKLLNQTWTLVGSSRALTPDDLYIAKNKNLVIRPYVIAYDAIVIICNPNLKKEIQGFSLENLRTLFFKSNAKSKYHIYSRPEESGTTETLKSILGIAKDQPLNKLSQTFESSEDIAAAVSKDPLGIGYVSFAFAGSNLYAAPISSSGRRYIDPNHKNIRDAVYPLSRNLYLIVTHPISNENLDLLHFLFSNAGQLLIEKSGFIGIRENNFRVPASNQPKSDIEARK